MDAKQTGCVIPSNKRGGCEADGVCYENLLQPKTKKAACKLRKNSTLSEVLLWEQLKNKQLIGYDFHRQKPIDEFIVDFYCPKLKLVIEIDGESHDGKIQEDKTREEKLKSLGLIYYVF